MAKICCIIVTYNRKKYLIKELDALIRQSYPIEGFIIINNDSPDDTFEYLSENGFTSKEKRIDEVVNSIYNGKEIYYYQSSANLGGSGGFKKGFEIAQSLDKYDYFWVMDDDICPRENCLENLISNFNDKYGIYVPKRIGENFKDSIVVKYRFNNPFVHLFFDRAVEAKKEAKTHEVNIITFEGPLIRKDILKKVGLPNDRYFLQGDDYDYAFRSLQYTKILYVCDAIIDRQIPFANTQNKPSIRDYYGARNAVLLDIRYCKNPIARYLRPRFFRLRWRLVYIIKHKDKELWRYVKTGINDAIHGIDGKKEM